MKFTSICTVGDARAVHITADKTHPVEVLNAQGHPIFYKTAADVDSGDTELAVGSKVEITDGTWFIAAAHTSSEVHVRELDSLAVGDNLSVAGKLHAEGEVEIEGDLNHDGTKVGFFGAAPAAKPNVKPAAEVNAKELCEALEKLGLIE